MTENRIGADRRIRDLVTAALLRRALIHTEGIVALMERGLMEPAVALSRVLLDIELNFRLVTKDPTERMAKRLARIPFPRRAAPRAEDAQQQGKPRAHGCE